MFPINPDAQLLCMTNAATAVLAIHCQRNLDFGTIQVERNRVLKHFIERIAAKIQS